MKKFFAIILCSIILLTFCLSLASCTHEKTIIGTWEYGEDGFSYTFKKDGTGYFKLGGQENTFTYTVHENELNILYDANTMTYNYTYTLGDDDTIVIIDQNGGKMTYNRK